MRLIGMLDSPYVRRTAIGLNLLGVPFTHEAVSVFSHFERFQKLNPVVKAPTLVLEDGKVLMDSSLILEYFESGSSNSLWSTDPDERLHEARIVSYALAACEKSIQAVYEQNLRPKALQFDGWLTRLTGQRHAAFQALETEIDAANPSLTHLSHASIAAAIAYQFASSELQDEINAAGYPGLASHSSRFEELSIFKKYPPIGPGI
jgi:glutathione S-transferase